MGNLLTSTKPHQPVAGQVLPEDPGEELAGMEGLPEGAEVATATATSWAGINPRRATSGAHGGARIQQQQRKLHKCNRHRHRVSVWTCGRRQARIHRNQYGLGGTCRLRIQCNRHSPGKQ